jgi:outer membrane lipoprotein-sorting protein
VKAMTMLEIQMLGGKMYPKIWRVHKTDQPDSYTQLTYIDLTFKDSLPDSLFTLSSLQKARR